MASATPRQSNRMTTGGRRIGYDESIMTEGSGPASIRNSAPDRRPGPAAARLVGADRRGRVWQANPTASLAAGLALELQLPAGREVDPLVAGAAIAVTLSAFGGRGPSGRLGAFALPAGVRDPAVPPGLGALVADEVSVRWATT
jgi:hypothetical protein